MNTLGKRIRVARGPKSQEDFAKMVGISKGSLGFYERDENLPNSEVILKICSEGDCPIEWLLTGKDPGEHGSSYPVRSEGNIEVIEASTADIILIPMVEAKLSAGHGSFETSDKSERKYSFRRDFLARKGNHKEMVLMRVSGDSMEPEIKDGDVVLLDQSQKSPLPGRIYAVGVEDMVYLKRIDAQPGKLILYSDNAAYKPLEIDTRGDMEHQARIIGRAIWWCREA